MNFGTTYTTTTLETKPCFVCKGQVPRADQIVVDKETLHKNCFKCGCCGAELKHGNAAQLKTAVGPRWFCSGRGTKACAMLDKPEREKNLKK
ncbi:hypothetical protein AAVH_24652 [Aphelenchoides avenae]|nr:hypothetical protein AAVH_24652 [Aphelenchus avenae]